MPWWGWVLLWLVIVAGTLVGALFLVRSLWDKAMGLFDELARFEEVAARLDAVVDAPESTWVHPLAATEADCDQWSAGIGERRAQRQVRRAARHAAAFRRWTRWWG